MKKRKRNCVQQKIMRQKANLRLIGEVMDFFFEQNDRKPAFIAGRERLSI
jgi:hypothetical protein